MCVALLKSRDKDLLKECLEKKKLTLFIKSESLTRQKLTQIKGCVRYIFASLFFKSKLEHLSNFSQENQILQFHILKFHDVIKCLSIKQEIHFTE